MASLSGLSAAVHCPLDGINAGQMASRPRNAKSGFSFVISGGGSIKFGWGSEMFGIQTSQTRLARAHSVPLDNRENFRVRDKYSGPTNCSIRFISRTKKSGKLRPA